MTYPWCSRNGDMVPENEAVVPLSRIEYAYGFGVYETVRVVRGQPMFMDEHCARLLQSARILTLEHRFTVGEVTRWTTELITKNNADVCNIKIMLIGGSAATDATLWILLLAPHFPEKQLFTKGCSVITVNHERFLPQAKTLNMLPSFLFYGQAKEAGCYDALLVNREGCITEGTRTNVLAVRGRTMISPPRSDILEGVTRAHVLDVAHKNGFTCIDEPIALADIAAYDGLCLTSTSTKIVPISHINTTELPIPQALRELMDHYDRFLDAVRA